MGIFVDYLSNPFASLSNTPQSIVVADMHTIWVTAIDITNRGAAPIRINLQKERNQTSPITIYRLNEFEVKPFSSVDLVKKITGVINLQYSSAPAISDSLVCFSNGYTQIFDCEVTYATLNELPIN